MATSYSKSEIRQGVLQSGYESDAPDSSFEVPSCGIEDVDRAFFNLFADKLPLLYKVSKNTGEMRRLPVMFASGERFAVLSKQTPLRDANGALILPMLSISRSGVEFETTKGAGTSDKVPETVIKRVISKESSQYKNLLASSTNNLFPKNTGLISSGRVLGPEYENCIYEYIVIPTPKYFTAKYEVTIWCQYVQQLNDFLETILSSFPQPNGRTIRIDSPNGYWFVAHFDQSIAQDNNFADYSDSERIVKATINVEVPGFLIAKGDTKPNNVKRYTSASRVAFDVRFGKGKNAPPSSALKNHDYNRYVLGESETVSDNFNGEYIGGKYQNDEATDRFSQLGGLDKNDASSIGEEIYTGGAKRIEKFEYDVVSGETRNVEAYVVDSNASVGEEVFFISNVGRR